GRSWRPFNSAWRRFCGGSYCDGSSISGQSSTRRSGSRRVNPSAPWLTSRGAGAVVDEEFFFAADDGRGDDVLPAGFLLGELEHDVEHQPFDHAAQPPGAGVLLFGDAGNL